MQLLKKRYPKFRIVKFGDKFHAETKKELFGEWKEIEKSIVYTNYYLTWTPNYKQDKGLNTYDDALNLIEEYKTYLFKQTELSVNKQIFTIKNN